MRVIAYLTAAAGLALMAFGLWGLQAPQTVQKFAGQAQQRALSLGKVALSKVKDAVPLDTAEVDVPPKEIQPVMDPDFVPVTIEEKYAKYLFCLSAEEPCPGFSREAFSLYYDDLRRQITFELNHYYEYLRANPLKIQDADARFARQLTKDPTADVQVVALKILDLFPSSYENLESAASVLRFTQDDGVLDVGLQVLAKYKNDKVYDRTITRTLKEQIRLGSSEFTSTLAARRLFPFLDSGNVEEFKKLRDELESLYAGHSRRSERLKILDSVLREYERDRLLNR